MDLVPKNSRLVFTYNYFSSARPTLEGEKLSPGEHTVRYEFAYDGGGPGKGGVNRLLVDGKSIAEGRMQKTVPALFSADESFDVGMDTGSPVGDYTAPFPFTGTIKQVVIDIGTATVSAE